MRESLIILRCADRPVAASSDPAALNRLSSQRRNRFADSAFGRTHENLKILPIPTTTLVIPTGFAALRRLFDAGRGPRAFSGIAKVILELG